ncbi:hypothetical protein ESY86_10250 [Subsaximicrobium wynnwilliamsii]|uniref:Uncharacterized protein n=1 Tax=Subsaximicrobium wynnwilliamsii TaxID=291179 RepID=A0A5C6ZI59_9FLAO|nr:hypothetical protein [Subsaximicrobium wynnwilliamsii]TXD83324.1 hypothetical protein ESY87_10170 [Subsaximicrobium wynnwilliamsii]TXD89139.1 hypothetical protein ESY86_10250 [Subsaximicrobium wynnwilliamsii]TXE03348.1 hypothetical protein ESY88_08470 [Subsaximicrobium wynnwilliamsii]
MIIAIAKGVVIVFGVFIIFMGFIMLFYPNQARSTLRKAGSTNFINYTEITIRLIPAISLILYADFSKFPGAFKILGWIMVITSLILYAVPRKTHHGFSMKSADILKPICFQLISPFALLFGGLILYNAF